MDLRWLPNFDLSALHAAWALTCGRRLLDQSLEQKLLPVAVEFARLSQGWQVPPGLFWRQLLGMAADLPINSELGERFYRRVVGGSPGATTLSQFTSVISQCENLFRQAYPQALEQLQLRSGPLQEAWEARGPGLLALMRRATDEDFLVESAAVVLVQPVVGGDGLAHIYTNRVHIEAMLTDVERRLPETLRLAWLLGQLNLDLPIYSDHVHGHALGEVAELALIPVVLTAAEEVELARLSPDVVQLALEHWIRTPAEKREVLADTLMAWWETATEGNWNWTTRLAALSKMIQ